MLKSFFLLSNLEDSVSQGWCFYYVFLHRINDSRVLKLMDLRRCAIRLQVCWFRGASHELVTWEESLQPADPACLQQDRESPGEATSVSGSAHQRGKKSKVFSPTWNCHNEGEQRAAEEGERSLRWRLTRKKRLCRDMAVARRAAQLWSLSDPDWSFSKSGFK